MTSPLIITVSPSDIVYIEYNKSNSTLLELNLSFSIIFNNAKCMNIRNRTMKITLNVSLIVLFLSQACVYSKTFQLSPYLQP